MDFARPAGQVDNVTDVDSGALLGIAVTAADTANGAWCYSTDNGANWNALGAVASNNARLLAADANTRLYFQPNANYNGTLATAITFRAWDQTSGSNGGLADTTSNGGTTAFSTATDTASLVVNAVNDAPSLYSSYFLGFINEDNVDDFGTYVSDVVSGGASDPDAGAVLGIAVTAADSTNGVWQFTLDGTTWQSMGTPTLTAAVLLPADATTRLRFVPNANWNGAATLSYKAWDQTSGVAGGTADASLCGGTTAFSSSTSGTSKQVLAVNDAPVLSGANNLSAISEDDVTSSGTLVSDLIAGQVTDPDSGALSGIAVTAVDNTNGAWQYTTNGGGIWTAFGSPSSGTARLLASDANTRVRFVPNADWNGTVTNGLTFRAWDRTTGTAGGTANTTTNGGTTAFSSATASASITVNPVNDSPIITSNGGRRHRFGQRRREHHGGHDGHVERRGREHPGLQHHWRRGRGEVHDRQQHRRTQLPCRAGLRGAERCWREQCV